MSTACELLGAMGVPIRNIISVATTKLPILTMSVNFWVGIQVLSSAIFIILRLLLTVMMEG